MKLWFLERADDLFRYDEVYAAVVAAQTEQDARRISPVDLGQNDGGNPTTLTVRCIGEAAAGIAEGNILCAIMHG